MLHIFKKRDYMPGIVYLCISLALAMRRGIESDKYANSNDQDW